MATAIAFVSYTWAGKRTPAISVTEAALGLFGIKNAE
jgi:hypothetical protein